MYKKSSTSRTNNLKLLNECKPQIVSDKNSLPTKIEYTCTYEQVMRRKQVYGLLRREL